MFINLKFVSITFFLGLFSEVWSQQKTKFVCDFISKKPVEYATVKILGNSLGTICNSRGEFTLQINKTDSVYISSVGFKDSIFQGLFIKDTLFVFPLINILKPVIVKSKKAVTTTFLGNGVDLINQRVKCSPNSGVNNTCMLWSAGGGAEFAELINLPDSNKIYSLNKFIIPLKKSGCWQPIFIQVYSKEENNDFPGKLLFRKAILLDTIKFIKDKAFIDLKEDNIFFQGEKSFFVSLSWDVTNLSNNCLTVLPLLKREDKFSFNRSLLSKNYHWFVFNGNSLAQSGTGRYSTFFITEVEEY